MRPPIRSSICTTRGICCIPEIAGALVNLGRRFRVRTETLDDPRLQAELRADCLGAAAASAFRRLKVGLIGQVYTHMSDMPIDEHRLLRATGRMLERPEVEEIENAYLRVSEAQLADMYEQFRAMYDVDETVTNEHLRFSEQTAVAFDQVITGHDISPFGYYWWGEARVDHPAPRPVGAGGLAAGRAGPPGASPKGMSSRRWRSRSLTCWARAACSSSSLAMDLAEGFLLMGHDGPSNVNMAQGRPRLKHLDVHHGKSGHGLGIDFEMQQGPVTLLNLTPVRRRRQLQAHLLGRRGDRRGRR